MESKEQEESVLEKWRQKFLMLLVYLKRAENKRTWLITWDITGAKNKF